MEKTHSLAQETYFAISAARCLHPSIHLRGSFLGSEKLERCDGVEQQEAVVMGEEGDRLRRRGSFAGSGAGVAFASSRRKLNKRSLSKANEKHGWSSAEPEGDGNDELLVEAALEDSAMQEKHENDRRKQKRLVIKPRFYFH